MPKPDHLPERVGKSRSDPSEVWIPVSPSNEVSQKVGKANLPLLQVDEDVSRVAVGDRDPGGLIAEQFTGDFGRKGEPNDACGPAKAVKRELTLLAGCQPQHEQ